MGSELVRQLRAGRSVLGPIPSRFESARIFCPSLEALDIRDRKAVHQYIGETLPDIVFHCAGNTNVDGCEDEPKEAMMVNGESAEHIAGACEVVGAKLVFVSTDYVFDGEKRIPYRENDCCAPKNVYGQSKLLGEQNVLRFCSRTFVVRTSWLYGFHGRNFVKTILRKAREDRQLRVVNDQYGNPTNAEDLAFHLLKLAATERYGIYHCTGKGVCSWYDFAAEIVKAAGLACTVVPCTSAEYPQKVKRPAYSALDHGALNAAAGDEMRPWRDALHDYIERLEDGR